MLLFCLVDEQNEMLFCSVPFSAGLSRVFGVLNAKKEEKLIETYSVTQTSLEQIFVQLAGEDEETAADRRRVNTGGPGKATKRASPTPRRWFV